MNLPLLEIIVNEVMWMLTFCLYLQKTMDLDDILDEVGHFGKFQAINYILIEFPILLSAAFSLTYVFTAGDLEYR